MLQSLEILVEWIRDSAIPMFSPLSGPVRAETSSTSCDQAVFVDQATGTRLFPDAVLLEIDRFG